MTGILNKSLIFKSVLIICIGLLVYTIASTSILRIEPTSLGLVSELPLAYYAGLLLLGFVWIIGFKSKFYLPAALALTVAFLYIAPAVIREPVWISNSYYPFGESLLINEHGHLIQNPAASMVSYHYWPLFLYFSSAFSMMTGLPDDLLLKLFPLLTVSVYGLLAFLILRIKLALPYASLGAAIVLASLFIRQQYFGPQAIAYILFLAMVLVVSLLFFGERTSGNNQRSLLVLLFLLFAVTTLMHPLTSFMELAVIFAFYLSDRFTVKRSPVRFGRLLLVAAVIWLAYNSYSAAPFFNTAIDHYSEIFTGSRGITIVGESSRVISSTAMRVNFITSWAIVGLTGFLAAISILNVLWKARRKRSELAFPLFNVFMLVLIGGFAFGGEYGAVEGYQRAFMFGLVPISFLIVSFLAKKPKAIFVVLFALLFLNIPAQYGSDTYRLATPPHMAGTAFIAEHAPDNIKLIGEFTLYIKYYEPTKSYQVLSVGLSSPFNRVPNSTTLREQFNNADYILVSELQHNLFMFYIGRDPLDEALSVTPGEETPLRINQICDTGDFRLLQPLNATNR